MFVLHEHVHAFFSFVERFKNKLKRHTTGWWLVWFIDTKRYSHNVLTDKKLMNANSNAKVSMYVYYEFLRIWGTEFIKSLGYRR